MGKKLKIGIIIDQLVPGGVQKSAINEARELIKLGHSVNLYVLTRSKYEYQYEDLSKGLSVYYLSDFNPSFFRKAIPIPYFSFLTHLHIINPFFVSRYTVLKNLDFIVSHGTTTCITAAAISKKLRIPYVAFIWDPMLYILEKTYQRTSLKYFFFLLKPIIKMYEADFLKSAAIVATTSKVHQNFIYKTYGISSNVIYPGSSAPKIIEQKNLENKYVLGYTRWELSKNPYIFIWLARRLPSDVRILIAGSWTDKEEHAKFKELIYLNNLDKKILLTSPITKKDLAKIARKSFVWIHPNYEALGIAGLEMAAYGLPIIIPKGSGLTELFVEKKHGFFPDPFDYQTFLDHINYLYNHPKLARSMGLKAANVAKNYSWRFHATTILEIINKYLSSERIYCLANAFVSPNSIGGGDRFLIETVLRAPKNIYLNIILPQIGFVHFQREVINHPNIKYLVLPKNSFDGSDIIFFIFGAYIIRTLQTIRLLKSIPIIKHIHTASDTFVDIIPAALMKLIYKDFIWSTRFFHFIENPLVRKGDILRNLYSYLQQKFSLWLMHYADKIIIDNEVLKHDLISKNFEPQKIFISTGGVDTAMMSRAKTRFSSKYKSDAIFTGRIAEHKGVLDAIFIWSEVNKYLPQAKLVMLGYGPSYVRKKLHDEINRLKLSKKVSIVGYIPNRNEQIKYLKNSMILLFLDYEAGFGLAVAEAMACGLPVVAYKLPIFGSIYKQGFLLTDPGNTIGAAEQVKKLLINPHLYQQLSVAATKEVQKLDWNIISRKFYQLLSN